MKKWGLRILSAILTFTVGTCAAIFVGRSLKPVLIQPVHIAPNINLQTPPTQIAEDTQTEDDSYVPIKPHQVSISPYEIKRLIDENSKAARQGQGYYLQLEPIWKQLGIKSRENIQNECYDTCGAYINKLELDDKPGKETLLRLSTQAMDRFLVFKQISIKGGASATWELLGYIDAFTRWNDFDPYRIVITGIQRWLVISETTGHGSGFGSYADTWYEVSENGVTPVLSYQTSLFAATWGIEPGKDRKTKVSAIEYQDGMIVLVLQSSTSYEGYREPNERFHLWANKRKATFIKGPDMEKFIFDPLHSEMTEKELNPNYGDEVSLTDEEFLKYNYRDLLKIANERWTKRKDWLFDFLKGCDDSIEKQSLYKTAVINDKCPY